MLKQKLDAQGYAIGWETMPAPITITPMTITPAPPGEGNKKSGKKGGP